MSGTGRARAGCISARPHPLTRVLCRPAASTALTSLRARRWVDRNTSAMSVHFTLYNPATHLFSSVALSTQLVPAEGLALSAQVESVAVFSSNSAPRWFPLLLPQVGSPATRPPAEPRAPQDQPHLQDGLWTCPSPALPPDPAVTPSHSRQPSRCGHRTGRLSGASKSVWPVGRQSS